MVLRFLLVLFSLNLIEHYYSMEKKSNFDFELELFRNLIKKESKSWIVDTQQKSWIKETKNGFLYKLLPQSSRTTSIRPRFDQETEINYGYKGSIREPGPIKIVSPKNNDRFDNWGG